MPRATSASSRPSQLSRLALPAVASAMPADVPRTMAKRGSAATRIVMKTSRPISPLQSRSLSGRELRRWRELIASESGRERREASPTGPTLWRPNYALASARPKIATAPLQRVIGLPQAMVGAGDEIRTRDHLLGRQGLYQLSYSRVAAYFIPRAAGATLRAVVDPGLALGVNLFLPDRHRVLQFVDEPLAGVERLAAMGGRHGDHHADLSHLQGPNPVDHRDVRDRPPPAGLLREVFNLCARHRPIGIVHQCTYPLAARMLADNPLEQHQRPVRIAADPIRNGGRVEGLLAQRYGTAPLADGASAHGRNDGQLVTLFQGVIPARVPRVHRTPARARQRAEVT